MADVQAVQTLPTPTHVPTDSRAEKALASQVTAISPQSVVSPPAYDTTIRPGRNITPLSSLRRYPALVYCEKCDANIKTTTKNKVTGTTHFMFFILTISTGLGGPFAYCSSAFKDAIHSCPRCGTKLATFHVCQKATEPYFL